MFEVQENFLDRFIKGDQDDKTDSSSEDSEDNQGDLVMQD